MYREALRKRRKYGISEPPKYISIKVRKYLNLNVIITRVRAREPKIKSTIYTTLQRRINIDASQKNDKENILRSEFLKAI